MNYSTKENYYCFLQASKKMFTRVSHQHWEVNKSPFLTTRKVKWKWAKRSEMKILVQKISHWLPSLYFDLPNAVIHQCVEINFLSSKDTNKQRVYIQSMAHDRQTVQTWRKMQSSKSRKQESRLLKILWNMIKAFAKIEFYQ